MFVGAACMITVTTNDKVHTAGYNTPHQLSSHTITVHVQHAHLWVGAIVVVCGFGADCDCQLELDPRTNGGLKAPPVSEPCLAKQCRRVLRCDEVVERQW
jgi:hypothetical protein